MGKLTGRIAAFEAAPPPVSMPPPKPAKPKPSAPPEQPAPAPPVKQASQLLAELAKLKEQNAELKSARRSITSDTSSRRKSIEDDAPSERQSAAVLDRLATPAEVAVPAEGMSIPELKLSTGTKSSKSSLESGSPNVLPLSTGSTRKGSGHHGHHHKKGPVPRSSDASARDSMDVDLSDRMSSFGSSIGSAMTSASTATAIADAAAQQELQEMRKKLGMLMLGGDMSGGQAGTHAALTLSNAVTNLSVGCWGQVTELEPLPQANLRKWRQQIRWHTEPLGMIVVKGTATKKLDDGSEIEVMVDSVREDIRVSLPKLEEMDNRMQALFARFSDADWKYRKLTPDEQASAGASGKWWKKVPHLPDGKELPARWVSELTCLVVWAHQQLRVCRDVQDAAIERMPVPDSFTEKLPKNARDVCKDSLRKAISKDQEPNVAAVLKKEGLSLDDKLGVMELVNNLEKAALIWAHKAEGGKSKKDTLSEHALRFVRAVKHECTSLVQSELEQAKLQHNRDVGAAVLEAYSRVLESRCTMMRDCSLEVLAVAKAAPNGLDRILAQGVDAMRMDMWLVSVDEDVAFLKKEETIDEPPPEEVKRASAEQNSASAAERLMAKRTKEEAAALASEVGKFLMESGASDRGNKQANTWEERKKEHDAAVKQGHTANRAGSTRGAMDKFERACRAFPKVSTYLSAVNMRFKIGESEHAACAASYVALLRMKLLPNELELVQARAAADAVVATVVVTEVVDVGRASCKSAPRACGLTCSRRSRRRPTPTRAIDSSGSPPRRTRSCARCRSGPPLTSVWGRGGGCSPTERRSSRRRSASA